MDLSPHLAEHRLSADPTLAQALINLLSNAADASEHNHRRDITMTAGVENDQLRITIDDHGPGLTESQQAKAGQVFFSNKASGLGMGLSIRAAQAFAGAAIGKPDQLINFTN